MRKLGWTYRHGTVCAPRQYLYPKEATGKERTEMYSTSRWRNPTHLCGPANYPVSWGRDSSQNRNLRKSGWTYRHATVFAPRQSLYPKEATGMERTEMYSTSRWRNPTYLCGPANNTVSWGTVEVPEQKLA